MIARRPSSLQSVLSGTEVLSVWRKEEERDIPCSHLAFLCGRSWSCLRKGSDAQPWVRHTLMETLLCLCSPPPHHTGGSLHPLWLELPWALYLQKQRGEFFRLAQNNSISSVSGIREVVLSGWGNSLSYSHPKARPFTFMLLLLSCSTPHPATFEDLCRVNAVSVAQQHSCPRWSSRAQFATRDGDGLLSLTLPGPAEWPFPFSLPCGCSLHISGGVHCHGEPFPGGKWLVHSSTRISMWQVLGDALKGWGMLQPLGTGPCME